MTGAEWMTCCDPIAMLALLRQRVGWRRRQLFCLACWDRVRPLMADDASRKALAYLELNVDFNWTGDIQIAAVQRASDRVDEVLRPIERRVWGQLEDDELWDEIESGEDLWLTDWHDPIAVEAASVLVTVAEALEAGHVRALFGMSPEMNADELAARFESHAKHIGQKAHTLRLATLRALADLVREAFCPPFRPVTIDPEWLAWSGGTVRTIAAAIDEERDFDRLPILGDALEDAGCDDPLLLSHLRGPGPHLPGCWALDTVLGRS